MLIQTLALLPSVLPQDIPQAGFELTGLAVPNVPSEEVITLPDGFMVANDGLGIRLVFPGGAQADNLGDFTPSGQAGAHAIDATGRYVVSGERIGGELRLADLQTGTSIEIGKLPGNYDAVVIDPNRVIVSSTGCDGLCGTTLVRIDIDTNEIKTLAHFEGEPGLLELEPDGDLLYAARDNITGNVSPIHRFSASDLEIGAPVFYEKGGYLAVEIESVPSYDQWVEETILDGFTGSSYYRWNGGDFFQTPGVAPLDYDLVIETPGTYTFEIHNRHDASPSDQQNDVWVRMDDGPWEKVYSNFGPASIGVWNWFSWFDNETTANEQAFYVLDAGSHRLQIAARSFGFMIDRFTLWQAPLVPDPQDLDEPESFRGLDLTQAPVVYSSFSDVTELALAPNDTVLVADVDPISGRGRLRSAVGQEVSLLARTSIGTTVDDMQFVEVDGVGQFLPYQPETGGEVFYQTTAGTAYGRQQLNPVRPELTLTGPGSTPSGGLLDFDVAGAPPGSIGFAIFGPPNGTGDELAIPGLPLIYTSINTGAIFLLPGSIGLDGAGSGSIQYSNPSGSGYGIVLQSVLFDLPLTKFVASTNGANL